MTVHGLEVNDAKGDLVFSLTTRLTNLLWEKEVSPGSSGSEVIQVPSYFDVTIHSVPLNMDGYLRHYPHKVVFDAATNTIHWEPSLIIQDSIINYFRDGGTPVRAASRIQAFGYVKDE